MFKHRFHYIITVTILSFFLLNNTISQEQNDPIADLIYEYQVKGYHFLTQVKNLDSAEYYYTKALNLQKTTLGVNTEKTAIILVNLATVYKRKYDYKTSFECSNQAEIILKKIDPEN